MATATRFRTSGLCLLFITALALAGPAPAAESTSPAETRNLGRHLEAEGVEGCFLLYGSDGTPVVRLNGARAEKRVPPASTFKILNSLIALETGALEDQHQVLPWDGKKRWLDKWNRDMDMSTAFALSAVWFYQEMARRVGLEEMSRHLRAVGYGNEETGDQIDTFWLEGPLRISPEEQIQFLRRLHSGNLPFSKRSLKIVREIMLFEEGAGYAVRAKTGWVLRQGENIGWYVGWIEREGGPWFFALNIESEAKDFPMFQARRRILRGILSDLALIPTERPAGSKL